MALILPGNVASATAAVGYDVANSVRFNKGDAPALKRDSMGTATDTKKWTLSMWVKRSTTAQAMLASFDGAKSYFQFQSGGQLEVNNVPGASFDYRLVTNAIYRDVSAWMHIVVAYDSTQGTASNRIKLYVNGSQPSLGTATYPDEDFDAEVNSTGSFKYGSYDDSSDFAFNGYMAELVFIDGTQYAASDFGEFNSDSPTIWQPVDPSGLTFGTNGHYLDFEASGNLGNDVNGGTDFDENNIAATDSSTDSPTNNFATWNSVIKTTAALVEGNLHYTTPGSNPVFGSLSTIGVTAGKWYGELNYTSGSEHKLVLGVADDNFNNGSTDASYDIGKSGAADSIAYVVNTGAYRINNSNTSWGSGGGDGNIINWAIDRDNGKLYFGVDNTWGNSSDPAAGSNGIPTTALDSSAAWFFGITSDTSGTGDVGEINFGNPSYANTSDAADANGYGAFEFAPPSGYYALCTKNLAEFG